METHFFGDREPLLELRRDISGALKDTALVALQHLLPSITSLFRRLFDAGFSPAKTFVLGKPYSSVPEVIQELIALGCHVHQPPNQHFRVGHYAEGYRKLVNDLWETISNKLTSDVKHVVVLDEGGWLLRVVPSSVLHGRRISAVEHTMFGVLTTQPGRSQFPLVLMAASAAKTQFESSVIADAIVDRLFECIPELSELNIGVIGLGNVGMAVSTVLHRRTQKPIVGFDIANYQIENQSFLTRVMNRADLVSRCEVVIGCTGDDALDDLNEIRHIRARRWLASCSSGDVEFSRIARQLAGRIPSFRSDPFQDAHGKVGVCHISLLNGGFPINFDRRRELEPISRIQLTRELTFASVIQAAICQVHGPATDGVMLDPAVQHALVERWLEDSEARSLFPNWRSQPLEWWTRYSKGEDQHSHLEDLVGVRARPTSSTPTISLSSST